MGNVKVKVRKSCNSAWYDIGVYEGKKLLLFNPDKSWRTEKAAIRNAKIIAKRIGIPYETEIIK